MSSAEKIRVAVVGVGAFGRNHARVYSELAKRGEAGVYVCRVVDRKVSRDRVFLVTDGGLHHHLAASGNFAAFFIPA